MLGWLGLLAARPCCARERGCLVGWASWLRPCCATKLRLGLGWVWMSLGQGCCNAQHVGVGGGRLLASAPAPVPLPPCFCAGAKVEAGGRDFVRNRRPCAAASMAPRADLHRGGFVGVQQGSALKTAAAHKCVADCGWGRWHPASLPSCAHISAHAGTCARMHACTQRPCACLQAQAHAGKVLPTRLQYKTHAARGLTDSCKLLPQPTYAHS